ncbi:hypothetical protein FB567DRAFT_597305 [Paraphoma chrysanthemicola]|uniref:Uncharacterized protein n=1 Tax=Paraphoma chrysanthemicola TaxID=798071 RepID=A0A8K0QXV7_9PLEO|nr:hypothetical protein FB567DRAFT_597305 [Paraphoma chrysanthemicola]
MKPIALISIVAALASGVLSAATEFAWTGDCKRQGPVVVEPLTVGATEGIARCEARWSQALAVRSFSAYYDEGMKWIRGIEVAYEDGSRSEVLGNAVGKRHGIQWNSGDRIKTFTLWPDEKGASVSRILIETNNGQKLDVGASTGSRKGMTQPVGGGMLVGVRAFTSWKVDGLSPIFLTKISKVTVDNIKFDVDPIKFMNDKKNLKERTIGEVQKFAAGTAPMVFYMRGKNKYTETTRFVTDDRLIGLSTAEKDPITYKALYPRVIGRIPKDTSKPIWWQGWGEFKSWETESVNNDVAYEHQIEVSAGQTLYCKTFIYYGEFASPYTSTVKVYSGNQDFLNFSSKGSFRAYTESTVGVKCLDSSEVDKRDEEELSRRFKRGTLGR